MVLVQIFKFFIPSAMLVNVNFYPPMANSTEGILGGKPLTQLFQCLAKPVEKCGRC